MNLKSLSSHLLIRETGSNRSNESKRVDEKEYKELVSKMPKDIDWTMLSEYEKTDMTSGSQELACTAGVCEIVDLVSPIAQTTSDVSEISL